MADVTSICNRALQKIGAKRIASITESTVSARACRACYEPLRDALLRDHIWNFAKRRAQLAASATEPEFGRANAFPLPADFLRLYRPYPEQNSLDIDYEIEGDEIISNLDSPLNVRYIAKISDVNSMDPLFREALSAIMAVEMCEEITQSNPKKAGLKDDYDRIILRAKKSNAIEVVAMQSPEDEWITVRR